MLTKEEIESKITELTEQQDELIKQANTRISYLDGQIAALKLVIATTEEKPVEEG